MHICPQSPKSTKSFIPNVVMGYPFLASNTKNLFIHSVECCSLRLSVSRLEDLFFMWKNSLFGKARLVFTFCVQKDFFHAVLRGAKIASTNDTTVLSFTSWVYNFYLMLRLSFTCRKKAADIGNIGRWYCLLFLLWFSINYNIRMINFQYLNRSLGDLFEIIRGETCMLSFFIAIL